MRQGLAVLFKFLCRNKIIQTKFFEHFHCPWTVDIAAVFVEMSANGDRITTAANVLGTIGTVLWCIQLVPQVVHNWRRKDCTGLPPLMMLLWSVSGVPLAIYFIVQRANIPLQIQPHIFMVLSMVCFGQSLYYPPNNVRLWKSVAICVSLLVVFAGIEAGCIIPFKRLYNQGINYPDTVVGIIAAILLALGLVPPYFELYKRQGRVVGINFIFLTIDSGGALFSLLSLVAQTGPLDILGGVGYISILVLELGIFASQAIWLIRLKLGQVSKTEEEDDEAIDEEQDIGKSQQAPVADVDNEERIEVPIRGITT